MWWRKTILSLIKSLFLVSIFIWFVKMKLILVFVLAIFETETLASKSYEYFKVYSVTCETKSEVERMKFWDNKPMVDFWSLPGVNRTSKILVGPEMQPVFEDFLLNENFNYKILIANVGRLSHQMIYLSNFFHQISVFFPRTIRNHTRNKLKFHFQDGNFTDTVARDFSHYWTWPEVNLGKSFFNRRFFFHPFFNSRWEDFSRTVWWGRWVI